MHLELNIDFGYRFLYSRQHYHPKYCWDGRIDCTDGKILSISRLTYSDSIYGPVHSPVETPLSGHEWKFSTQREIAGIHVVVECDQTAELSIKTAQGDFYFSARQILKEGRIVFPVGSKYSHCTIIVTKKGYLWFRPKPLMDETVVEPVAFKGANIIHWSRMEQAWIDPACETEFDVTLPEFQGGDENHWLFHLQGMTAKKTNVAEGDALDLSQEPPLNSTAVASDYIPMELYCDGRFLQSLRYYFRDHDCHVQILHDVWSMIPAEAISPGHHRFKLINRHPSLPLLVNRISFRPKIRRHLDLQTSIWALVGKETI